MMRFELDLSRC